MAQLKLIAGQLSVAEGIAARSYLEAFGIHVALAGYYHGTAAWHQLFAIGGLQLWVIDSDEEVALQLLSSKTWDVQDEQPDHDITGLRASIRECLIAALAFAVTGLPFPVWVRRLQRTNHSE